MIAKALQATFRIRGRTRPCAAATSTSRSSTCSSRCCTTATSTDVVRACGGDVEALKKQLDEFIEQDATNSSARSDVAADAHDDAPARHPVRAAARAELRAEGSRHRADAGRDLSGRADRRPSSSCAARASSKLDVLNYLSHGIAEGRSERASSRRSRTRRRGRAAPSRDPLKTLRRRTCSSARRRARSIR